MGAATESKRLASYLFADDDDPLYRVLDRVADGMGLHEACKLYQVSVRKFRGKIENSPEFARAYLSAREFGIDARVDLLHLIGKTEADVDRARLICSNIKWEAEKAFPSRYGGNGMIGKGRAAEEKGKDELDSLLSDVDGKQPLIGLPAPANEETAGPDG